MSDHDRPWPDPPPGWRHDAPDPPDSFPVPFTILDGFGLVFVSFLVVPLLVRLPLDVAGVDVAEGGLALLLASVVVQLFTLAAALAWLRIRGVLGWRLLGPLRPAGRHVAIGIGVGASGWFFITLLLVLVSQWFGPIDPPSQESLRSVSEGGAALAVGIVMAVVLAPVVEELIYRSVLFQSMRHRMGLFPAMFLSGAVFAAVHLDVGDPLYTVGLWILGIWFAGAFHRTGTLVVPVAAHATFNAIAIALSILVRPDGA